MLYLGNTDGDAGGELAIGDPGYGVWSDGRIEIVDTTTGAMELELFAAIGFGGYGANLSKYHDVDGDGQAEFATTRKQGFFGQFSIALISPVHGSEVGSIEPVTTETLLGSVLMDVGDIEGDGSPDYVIAVGNAAVCDFGVEQTPFVWVAGADDDVMYQHKPICGQSFSYGASGALINGPTANASRILVVRRTDACGPPMGCKSWVAVRLQAPKPHAPGGSGGACHGLALTWSGWAPSFQGFQTQLELDGATPYQLNFLLLSLDASQWAGIPLPLDLTSFGAPGCSLLVPPDVLVAELADASGHAETGLVLSKDEPTLYGVSAYAQWVGYTPFNPLSLATSDALELILLP